MGKKSRKSEKAADKVGSSKKAAKQKVSFFVPKEFWLGLLIVVIPTAIAFYPSLQNGWTNWDDPTYVTESFIIKSTDAENVKRIFTIGNEGYISGNYHPLTIYSLALEYQSAFNPKDGTVDPAIFHRNNYLLHIINSCLVFAFCFLLFGRIEIAALSGLLFGIHPMHVESVAWIAERKDVFYAFFFFLSLIAYIGFIKRSGKNLLLYILALVFFIGSCLSKGQAVTLVGVLVIIDWFLDRNLKSPRLWFEKVPFLLIALATGLIAVQAQETAEAIADNEVWPIHQRIFLAFNSLIIYLGKCIAPIDLACFYPYPKKINDAIAWYYYVSPVVLLLTWPVFKSLKSGKTILFGTLFFLGNIALLLQVMAVGSAVIAERYAYISYVGLFIIMGFGIVKLLDWKPKLKMGIVGVVGIYSIAFIVMTMNRCEVWESSLTLWNDCIEKRPTFQVAYNNRGNYYSRELQDYDKALVDYERCISLEPNYFNVYVNRGNIHGIRGNHQAAIDDYTRALNLKSNAMDAIINRAMSYAILKNYEPALADYALALQYQPNHPNVYSMRGYTYIELQDFDNAISDYTRFFSLGQQNFNAWYYRGFAYQRLGKNNEALADYNRALQFNPNHAGVHNNRARANQALGNLNAALADAIRAKQLGHNVPDQYLKELRSLGAQ